VLTREIPSFEDREVPFQGACSQNGVVPRFIEPAIGRAEAGTEGDVIPDRGMLKP